MPAGKFPGAHIARIGPRFRRRHAVLEGNRPLGYTFVVSMNAGRVFELQGRNKARSRPVCFALTGRRTSVSTLTQGVALGCFVAALSVLNAAPIRKLSKSYLRRQARFPHENHESPGQEKTRSRRLAR